MENKNLTFVQIGSLVRNSRTYIVAECCRCKLQREIRSDIFNKAGYAECECIEKEKYVGSVYGKLKIIDIVNSKFLCECQCGSSVQKLFKKSTILSGHTKSCGCAILEMRKYKYENKIDKRIHNIWTKMKQRCYKQNYVDYKNYGSRGIIVCDEWKNSSKKFVKWALNNGYAENLTIERINVNGNYEPSNCTWITNEEQANNRRTTNFVIYNNEKYNITQLAKKLNTTRNHIYKMLKQGLISKAISDDDSPKSEERVGGIGSTNNQ